MKPNRTHKILRITTVPASLAILLRGQLHYLNHYYEVVGVSSNSNQLIEVRKKEHIRVLAIRLTRKFSPIVDIISFFSLAILIIKERPSVVHTHTPKAGTVGMLAAWVCRVPVRMHTVAGLPLLETTGCGRILLDLVEKITYRCAHKVYPNSNGLKRIIIRNGYCKSEKLQVLVNGSSNGIDTAYYSSESVNESQVVDTKKKCHITANDFVFTFIGRLVGDKGINELVNSFDRISQKYKNVKLLLVGPYENDLDKLNSNTLETINSNLKIVSTGFIEDVRPFLAISNLLVFPSYREGFPNVVMQAGAMGLPSIVTDINGCNEIIIDGENGIIIPPKNIDALYATMERFLLSPELQVKLAKNAREMIVSRYEQSVVWEAIKGEYDYWLAKKGLL